MLLAEILLHLIIVFGSRVGLDTIFSSIELLFLLLHVLNRLKIQPLLGLQRVFMLSVIIKRINRQNRVLIRFFKCTLLFGAGDQFRLIVYRLILLLSRDSESWEGFVSFLQVQVRSHFERTNMDVFACDKGSSGLVPFVFI